MHHSFFLARLFNTSRMLSSLYQLRQRSRDDMSLQPPQSPTLSPLGPPSLPEIDEPVGCFARDEIYEIGQLAIEEVLTDSTYMEDKITSWNNVIIDKVLAELVKLKKPYKYIVFCTLQQKTGAGIHEASAFFWEPRTDSTCTVKWDNDFIRCRLHVIGVMI